MRNDCLKKRFRTAQNKLIAIVLCVRRNVTARSLYEFEFSLLLDFFVIMIAFTRQKQGCECAQRRRRRRRIEIGNATSTSSKRRPLGSVDDDDNKCILVLKYLLFLLLIETQLYFSFLAWWWWRLLWWQLHCVGRHRWCTTYDNNSGNSNDNSRVW